MDTAERISHLNVSDPGLLALLALWQDEKPSGLCIHDVRVPYDQFKSALVRHQVIVELAPVLSQLDEVYSESEYKDLSALVEQEVIRQMRLAREMLSILSLYEKEGIKVVPFKGPALSHELYGEYVRKTSSDLDLLVSPDQLMQAERLLFQKGYTSKKYEFNHFNRLYWSFFKRFNYHGAYFNANEGILIELHWKFFATADAFPKKHRQVIRDSLNQERKGEHYVKLVKEDLIVYLAMHGTVHLWIRLKWILDIRGFMLKHGDGTDWQLVKEACERANLSRAVTLALRLSHVFFNTTVPAQFEWNSQDRHLNELWNIALDSLQGEFNPASRTQYNRVMRVVKGNAYSTAIYKLQDYGHDLINRLSGSRSE